MINNIFPVDLPVASITTTFRAEGLTEQELLKAVVVVKAPHLTCRAMRSGNDSHESIYYIGEIDRLFTEPQFKKYVEEHPQQNFVVWNDTHMTGWGHQPMGYVIKEPGKLEIRLYDINKDYHYELIATVSNIRNTCKWKAPKVYSKTVKQFIINSDEDSYMQGIYYDPATIYDDHKENNFYLWDTTKSAYVNESIGSVMPKYIEIEGQSRIITNVRDNSFAFEKATCNRCTDPLLSKWGAHEDLVKGYDRYQLPAYDPTEEYPDSPIDDATKTRIWDYITDCLTQERQLTVAPRYRRYCRDECEDFKFKAVTVISAPAPRHKCPTFHYIAGTKSNEGIIEILEIARGELQMKDMIPKTCYLLDQSGKFFRVRNRLYTAIREVVVEHGDIDQVSLQQWAEDKSLHPELLQTVAACNATSYLGLDTIKIFNRLPFGALFMEQLIKGNKFRLAKQLADYIHTRADNMDFVCSSLKDIFPDANPEGTTLLKAFNLTKPCYDLMFELTGNESDETRGRYINHKYVYTGTYVENCIESYKLIKTYIPDGIVTSENKKMLTQFTTLKACKWVAFAGVSIMKYPNLLKPLFKMKNRLDNCFNNTEKQLEAKRKYEEIVTAYVKFLELGWNPEDHKIFIEFGLSGTVAENFQELSEREAAANKALKIYNDKLNEAAHKATEKKYANRLAMIEKLTAKQIVVEGLDEEKHTFCVVAPSQIYGEDTINSIEKEGHDMRHCLFRQYADQIAEGRYTVVYLRDKRCPNESLVTIGITSDGRINQTYAKDDKAIDPIQASAIAKWAYSKRELVTFNSERSVVQPGGWCCGVGLPTLPAINKKWLHDLADITDKPDAPKPIIDMDASAFDIATA